MSKQRGKPAITANCVFISIVLKVCHNNHSHMTVTQAFYHSDLTQFYLPTYKHVYLLITISDSDMQKYQK